LWELITWVRVRKYVSQIVMKKKNKTRIL